MPYYLNEAKLLELTKGARQLDYLDLHVYPQAQAPSTTAIFMGDTSAATNALRLRSTAILWDPGYLVESWESCCVYDNTGSLHIVARMRDWIAQQYPGTLIAISSYGWGAYNHITGALAQADVLGIFAREGVSLATLDAPAFDGQLVEDAFKLYRNYDGAGARFGSTSVGATSDDANVTTYAALNGRVVTVVLINKSPAITAQTDVTFPGAGTGSWRTFGFTIGMRLAALNTGALATPGGAVTLALQPYSAQVLELTADMDLPDAGMPDAGPPDAGPPDAGGPDAGAPDGGTTVDSGTPDSGTPADSGTPDAGHVTPPDAGTPDAGMTLMNPTGCGCNAFPAPLLALALLMLKRRRR